MLNLNFMGLEDYQINYAQKYMHSIIGLTSRLNIIKHQYLLQEESIRIMIGTINRHMNFI